MQPALVHSHVGFLSRRLPIDIAALPEYPWKEWLFARVPSHFWEDATNRRRYLDWLGEQLGFRKPSDWLRVSHEDIQAHHGSGLMSRRRTYRHVLEEYLPSLDWSARVDRRLA